MAHSAQSSLMTEKSCYSSSVLSCVISPARVVAALTPLDGTINKKIDPFPFKAMTLVSYACAPFEEDRYNFTIVCKRLIA